MKFKVKIEDVRRVYWQSGRYYVKVCDEEGSYIESDNCLFFPDLTARKIIRKHKRELKRVDKSREYEVDL